MVSNSVKPRPAEIALMLVNPLGKFAPGLTRRHGCDIG